MTDNIDKLIQAINIILVKNRRYFSAEDIALLKRCLKELRSIKRLLINKKSSSSILHRFIKVVELLDIFFGLTDHIKQYFNLPS